MRKGRDVIDSALPDNPYHAEIVLPKDAVDNRDEQIAHAKELADAARWHRR